MKLQLLKDSVDVTLIIFIQDSSSAIGAGLTGLVFNSAGLTAYYARPLVAATQLTLVTQTVTGAHSDGGFVEIDATNLPGFYRLDLSDPILAVGVDSVALLLKGATDMAPLPIEIQLTDFDLNSALVDTYQAKVWVFDDNSGTTDRYAVVYFKNAQPVTSGITSPTIQVIKAADGTDLIASVALVEIGSLGLWKRDEVTNRMVDGAAYMAKIEATIDGATRTWFQPVGRDS